jgi:hypothetical protein
VSAEVFAGLLKSGIPEPADVVPRKCLSCGWISIFFTGLFPLRSAHCHSFSGVEIDKLLKCRGHRSD